jgi:hypothetical protein
MIGYDKVDKFSHFIFAPHVTSAVNWQAATDHSVSDALFRAKASPSARCVTAANAVSRKIDIFNNSSYRHKDRN